MVHLSTYNTTERVGMNADTHGSLPNNSDFRLIKKRGENTCLSVMYHVQVIRTIIIIRTHTHNNNYYYVLNVHTYAYAHAHVLRLDVARAALHVSSMRGSFKGKYKTPGRLHSECKQDEGNVSLSPVLLR